MSQNRPDVNQTCSDLFVSSDRRRRTSSGSAAAFRAAYADDPNVNDIRAEDLLGEYPSVRYYPPSGDLYFDVMTRLGRAFDRFLRQHCARYRPSLRAPTRGASSSSARSMSEIRAARRGTR